MKKWFERRDGSEEKEEDEDDQKEMEQQSKKHYGYSDLKIEIGGADEKNSGLKTPQVNARNKMDKSLVASRYSQLITVHKQEPEAQSLRPKIEPNPQILAAK